MRHPGPRPETSPGSHFALLVVGMLASGFLPIPIAAADPGARVAWQDLAFSAQGGAGEWLGGYQAFAGPGQTLSEVEFTYVMEVQIFPFPQDTSPVLLVRTPEPTLLDANAFEESGARGGSVYLPDAEGEVFRFTGSGWVYPYTAHVDLSHNLVAPLPPTTVSAQHAEARGVFFAVASTAPWRMHLTIVPDEEYVSPGAPRLQAPEYVATGAGTRATFAQAVVTEATVGAEATLHHDAVGDVSLAPETAVGRGTLGHTHAVLEMAATLPEDGWTHLSLLHDRDLPGGRGARAYAIRFPSGHVEAIPDVRYQGGGGSVLFPFGAPEAYGFYADRAGEFSARFQFAEDMRDVRAVLLSMPGGQDARPPSLRHDTHYPCEGARCAVFARAVVYNAEIIVTDATSSA